CVGWGREPNRRGRAPTRPPRPLTTRLRTRPNRATHLKVATVDACPGGVRQARDERLPWTICRRFGGPPPPPGRGCGPRRLRGADPPPPAPRLRFRLPAPPRQRRGPRPGPGDLRQALPQPRPLRPRAAIRALVLEARRKHHHQLPPQASSHPR